MGGPQNNASGTPNHDDGAGAQHSPKLPAPFEEFVSRPSSARPQARSNNGPRPNGPRPTFQEFSRGSQPKSTTPATARNPKSAPSIPPTVTVSSNPTPSTATVPAPSAPTAPSPPPAKVGFSEQTQRIQAWGSLLKSLQPLIWGAIILVIIIPLLGKVLLSHAIAPAQVERFLQPRTEIALQPLPKQAKMDKALSEAVQTARASTETFAAIKLDDWQQDLIFRVDGFLDWYFDYFNQKKMEFTTPFVWGWSAVTRFVTGDEQVDANAAVNARFTEDFQREFAKRVLVPRNAQMRLEVITNDTVSYYVKALSQNIDKVQSQYRIPQGQWERYLGDISTTIQDTEGNLSNLSLKMLVGGSSYLLTKPLILATAGKIGSKISTQLAGKATAKLAVKTGGTVAAELGTTLVDPIVGVGIFIWDIWDYKHTVNLERPLLRANLLDYLKDVKQALLTNPETGVMSAIYELEAGIFQSI